MTINDRDRGWLEGLIDGEGSLILRFYIGKTKKKSGKVYFGKDNVSPILSISNNELEILERAREIIGNGGYIISKNSYNGKTNYELRYGSNLLRELLPYLRFTSPAREKKRLLILEYLSYARTGRNQHTKDENFISDLKRRYFSINKKWGEDHDGNARAKGQVQRSHGQDRGF